MDGKDYHYGQIKNVLLKQKFVSLVIPISTLLSKDSTSVAFLASKVWFTFSDAIVSLFSYRSPITFRSSWHRGSQQSPLCEKPFKALTAVDDLKDLKARLDQFLPIWKQLLLVTLGRL